MTLFLRTEMHRENSTDGGVYFGALFFGLLMIMLNGTEELFRTIAKLPVFYKQKGPFVLSTMGVSYSHHGLIPLSPIYHYLLSDNMQLYA